MNLTPALTERRMRGIGTHRRDICVTRPLALSGITYIRTFLP